MSGKIADVSPQIAENDYFRKQDQELIENLRRKAAKQAEDERLTRTFGISDPQLVKELIGLGFTRETLKLLHLVPLIQVAWADASVSRKETAEILEIASLRGIQPGGVPYDLLVRWLSQKPSDRLFNTCLRGIQAFLRSTAPTEATYLGQDLVLLCTRVASASGGFLGLEPSISLKEQRLLTRLAKDLELSHHTSGRQALAELEPDR